jgi:hypothetical protein
MAEQAETDLEMTGEGALDGGGLRDCPHPEAKSRATLKPGLPYIWVTWMTKLISGESSCRFSLWFRARYRFEKLLPGADLTRWTADHEELVRNRVVDLRLAHIDTRLEVGMTVQGRLATLSGKPDIRYEFDGHAVFEDAKTGRRRDSDHVQVLLYLWLHKMQTKQLGIGRVVYRDGVEDVDLDRLADVEREASRLLRMCADVETPLPFRSRSECRSCNIGRRDCSVRDDAGAAEVFVTEVF